jgi:hypothetical protein
MAHDHAGRTLRLSVLAVAVLAFAAAGVAYATIPDAGGTIHGCYSPSIGPGVLRVIDTGKGQACHSTEHSLNWNQTGPPGSPGAPGPPGTAGPTVLFEGQTASVGSSATLISHTVTAAEAGLSILANPFLVSDVNGTTGGQASVTCAVLINNAGGHGWVVTLHDSGSATQGDTTSATNLVRTTLAAGDVVTVRCSAVVDPNESGVNTQLLIEHVNS